jgi:hypothetical protein
VSPEISVKEPDNLTWTEVVRRENDRNKNRSRSRSDKINENDR